MDVKTASSLELTRALTIAAIAHNEGPTNPRYADAAATIREVGGELLTRFQEMLRTARTSHERDDARLGIRLMTNRLAEL